MIRQLQDLRGGRRFTIRGRSGKLLRKGAGAAEVEIQCEEERTFQTASGKQVRIRKSRERSVWSLATEVEVSR